MNSKNNYNKTLQVKIKTWKSDSDGIFQYKIDSANYKNKQSQIIEKKYIIRNKSNNTIEVVNQSEFDNYRDGEILFYARKSFKTGLFELINPVRKNMLKNENNIHNLNNRLWYVLKSKKEYNEIDNEDYNLNENDIIKLGRRKFEVIKKNVVISYKNENKDNYNISEMNKRVGSIFDINIKRDQYKITEQEIKNEEKEIKIKEKEQKFEKNNKNNFENFYENNDENIFQDYESEEIGEGKCRICFEVKSTKNNPKLCLCQCKDYIHYECLKKYISTKLKVKENDKLTVKTYICNKFNCEVCLSPYPLRFRIPEFNKIYELIDLTMPSELDYIILESLDFIKDNANLKTVHIVKLNEDEIHIGRYETNDIIDSNISVSRKQAIMTYNKDNGKLIMENLSEKFGTLVLIKGNIKMKEKNIHLQSGKSYIVAKIGEYNDLNDNLENNNIIIEENNDSDN